MSRKKVIVLICSLIVILGIGVVSGGIIASQQKPTIHKQAQMDKKTNKHVDKKASKKSNKQSSSSSSMDDESSKFNNLPQKTQLALLINHQSFTVGLDKPLTNTHYFPLMGVPNKIVIFNDGGAGTDIEHSFMITDNYDDTYSFSSVSSVAKTSAFQTDKNSWWQFKSKVSKTQLMDEYANSKDIVNQVASLINLSRSNESFKSVPENQVEQPADAYNYDDDYYLRQQEDNSSDEDEDYSDDDANYSDNEDTDSSHEEDATDDDYYANKAREPNADYYLPDGTHIHNDDQGNSYMDDGTVLGKGGSAGN